MLLGVIYALMSWFCWLFFNIKLLIAPNCPILNPFSSVISNWIPSVGWKETGLTIFYKLNLIIVLAFNTVFFRLILQDNELKLVQVIEVEDSKVVFVVCIELGRVSDNIMLTFTSKFSDTVNETLLVPEFLKLV